jgi:hypothetical protein
VTERGPLGRLWARATGRWQLERLAALDAKVVKFGREQHDAIVEERRLLAQIREEIAGKAGVEAVKTLRRQVEDVQTSLVQQDRAIAGALERARVLDEQGVDDRRFARRIEQFLRHDRPIIIGPWTGEVGFELLYWVPFVRWVVRTYHLPLDRLIVVSRGGCASWYGELARRYVDIFSLVSVEDFRAATERSKKQRVVGAFDALLVERVMTALALDRPALLHPGMMYRLFMPYWKELATAARIDAYTSYERVGGVEETAVESLPPDYVAARFYFSDCFPDTAANRAFVSEMLEAIGRQTPVVLLHTPFAVDDHLDAVPASANIMSIADAMTPERNLAVQTAVIGRARAFVGTYGGYSYLAPLCGVPSLAFYSARTFKTQHLHMADRVFERLGGAALVPLDVASLPLVRAVLNTITAATR